VSVSQTPRDPARYALVARLGGATAALMFVLIVVGSIVRTTDSGLACPDWPKCHGQWIPPMQFNIFMEWLHRLIALVVGLGLASTALAIVTSAATRARLGGLALLAIAIYFSQALLGALTVWKLLDPNVVSGHLAVGLLLFSTLLTITLLARHEASPANLPARAPGLLPLFAGSTVAVWAQAVLGGMVSTNHASLICHDWPTCNGEWFPPMIGLVAIQMSHRFGAYALITLLGVLAWRSRGMSDPVVARIARGMFHLVLFQAAVGIGNIFMGIPVWVSALHLGNAALLLALGIVGTFRLAMAREVRA
jgi:heme a synthase